MVSSQARLRDSPSVTSLPGWMALHNSAHPIDLPEEGYYLVMAHRHLSRGSPGACKLRNDTRGCWRYGYNYQQYFILFDRKPPFETLHVSPSFCFVSGTKSSRCESVQLVGSTLVEGADLLITYGINDCEAAVV